MHCQIFKREVSLNFPDIEGKDEERGGRIEGEIKDATAREKK